MDTKVCSALSLLCRDVGKALTDFADALSDIGTIRGEDGKKGKKQQKEQTSMRAGEGSADSADGGGATVRRRWRF